MEKLKAQIEKDTIKLENDMELTLEREWDRAKDQLRKDWENQI